MQFTFLLTAEVMIMTWEQHALQTSKQVNPKQQRSRQNNICEEMDGDIFPSWEIKTEEEEQRSFVRRLYGPDHTSQYPGASGGGGTPTQL
jgi:hypothetical protein